jgi:hypothetical protein
LGIISVKSIMEHSTRHATSDYVCVFSPVALGLLLVTCTVQHYCEELVLSEDGVTIATDNIHLSTVHI